MCAPEGSGPLARLRWEWRHAYYRVSTAYVCAMVTIITACELADRGGCW